MSDMGEAFAIFLTDFADQGVMLPVLAAVPITLLVLRRQRLAAAWLMATGFVLGTMLLLKLALYTCEILSPALPFARIGLVSPSGHVACAASAYAGLLAILSLRRAVPNAMRRVCLTSVCIAVVIGVTRVLLGEHTLAEVIAGAVVGIAGAALLTRLARSFGATGGMGRRSTAALAGVTVAVMLSFHGVHFSLEQEIRVVSAQVVRG